MFGTFCHLCVRPLITDYQALTATAFLNPRLLSGHVDSLPEQVQIEIEGAEHLFRELRIENTLHDALEKFCRGGR